MYAAESQPRGHGSRRAGLVDDPTQPRIDAQAAAWTTAHAPSADSPSVPSRLYTDEDPATTIKGLGFRDAEAAGDFAELKLLVSSLTELKLGDWLEKEAALAEEACTETMSTLEAGKEKVSTCTSIQTARAMTNDYTKLSEKVKRLPGMDTKRMEKLQTELIGMTSASSSDKNTMETAGLRKIAVQPAP